MKKTNILIIIGIIIFVCNASETKKHNYMPKEGYVPDKETAIKIAIAVWSPIYGHEKIKNEKPFKAVLKDSIWHIKGSLKGYVKGGVAEAEINKMTGMILRISHGK